MQPGQIYTDFVVFATYYFIMNCTGTPPVHHRYTTGTPPVHHRYPTSSILIHVHSHLTNFFRTHNKFLPIVLNTTRCSRKQRNTLINDNSCVFYHLVDKPLFLYRLRQYQLANVNVIIYNMIAPHTEYPRH